MKFKPVCASVPVRARECLRWYVHDMVSNRTMMSLDDRRVLAMVGLIWWNMIDAHSCQPSYWFLQHKTQDLSAKSFSGNFTWAMKSCRSAVKICEPFISSTWERCPQGKAYVCFTPWQRRTSSNSNGLTMDQWLVTQSASGFNEFKESWTGSSRIHWAPWQKQH